MKQNATLMNNRFDLVKMTVSEYLSLSVVMPDYQRGSVWTAPDFMGLYQTIKNAEPLPTLVLSEVAGTKYLLDGQQRTNAFRALIKNPLFAQLVNSYELSVQMVSFDKHEDSVNLFNRINSKSGLSLAQKSKGLITSDFRPLYDYISKHPTIRKHFVKTSTKKVSDTFTIEGSVEKLEEITSMLLVATLYPIMISTSSQSVTSVLKGSWTPTKDMNEYTADIDRRLAVVDEVLTKVSTFAGKVKSAKALYIACYLLSTDYTADILARSLLSIFDSTGGVIGGNEKVLLADGSKPEKSARELFCAGVSNDSTHTILKVGYIKAVCEKRVRADRKIATPLTAEETAQLASM